MYLNCTMLGGSSSYNRLDVMKKLAEAHREDQPPAETPATPAVEAPAAETPAAETPTAPELVQPKAEE